MVGWDNASHASAATTSGLFHPATATVTSATAIYSLGSTTASPTFASSSSTGGGDMGGPQVSRVCLPTSDISFRC